MVASSPRTEHKGEKPNDCVIDEEEAREKTQYLWLQAHLRRQFMDTIP